MVDMVDMVHMVHMVDMVHMMDMVDMVLCIRNHKHYTTICQPSAEICWPCQLNAADEAPETPKTLQGLRIYCLPTRIKRTAVK